MAYISVTDFKYGMDRRRERVAGTPGTLWTLENGHVTRGADIERAKKFVPVYSLTSGTHGLTSRGKQLYVFGSANLAASMPIGVTYQRLQSPNSGALTEIVDVVGFAGKNYVIADFDDGGRFHFYDGARVTDWDTVAAASADYTSLAQLFADKINADAAVFAEAFGAVLRIAANVAGTAFTISSATVDHGGTNDQTATVATPQANVAAVAEARATVGLTVNSGSTGSLDTITIGAANVLATPVSWSASNEATAIRIAQQINNWTSMSGFSASVSGAHVTIAAAVGTGATPNGTSVSVGTTGAISVSTGSVLAGGVTAVTAVAQVSTVTFGGTFEPTDQFTITINGTAYKATGLASGTGRSCNVFYKRVWSPAGSLWRYSKLTDATVWDPAASGSDAGFLNVALDSEGNQNLVAAERYMNYVAIYGEEAVVLYTLDTDPANFAVYMTLENTSTDAARSIIRYGNNDVFHKDPTGIRSLRALNASNAPFVSDVGNALDTFVLDFLDTLTPKQQRAAVSAIEPRDGRFLMAVGDRVFVLSFFPGAKISAWSYYSPGYAIEAWAKINKRLYARSGDTIYLYGGLDGETYPDDDELLCTVELPFLSANTPGTKKGMTGFDAAFTNEWQVDLLVDPNKEAATVNVGKVRNSTYSSGDIAAVGQAGVIAAKFVCSRAGRATVSMAQLHFQKEDEG